MNSAVMIVIAVAVSLFTDGLIGWTFGKIIDAEGNAEVHILTGVIGGTAGSWLAGLFGVFGKNLAAGFILSVICCCLVLMAAGIFTGTKE